MISIYTIRRIALYEAKLLFRSWGFRIFSGLGLLILTLFTVGIGTTVIPTPYFFHALSGSLPLNSIKLFNVYQGIIAAFLATEFFKRDRKHDTNEVVFARSFSNAEYILGKVAGILGVFFILNLLVMLMTFVIHFFFSPGVFAWQPYLLFPLLISLPTVVFITGLSILLINLIRSQAVVFILMLGYSFLALVFIGPNLFCLFDSYAFYQPLIYSDFIGGNLSAVLPVRSAYLLLGLGFIGLSSLLTKRPRQSAAPNIGSGVVSAICILLAVILGYSHVNGKLADRGYREQLKTSSKAVINEPTVSIAKCDIRLQHTNDEITATAALNMVNDSPTPLNSLLLTLNPGLKIEEVSNNGIKLQFQRDNHLLRIKPPSILKTNDSIDVSITYSGPIDERYCYLDIPVEQLESRYRLWLYDIPKRYAVVTAGYLHLTPESGWYPVSGLPPGAAFPAPVRRHYTKYTLSVTVPAGQTAISQGNSVIETSGNQAIYSFRPETLLPQISLTVGNYDRHRVEVDGLIYSLYTLPGHDYFKPYLNELKDKETISKLIRDLKNQYEVMLGLEYPFFQLSLVEVPIQFFSYRRLWTSAQDTVQPQLVYLPEMGTICDSADFAMFSRMMRRFRGRRNIQMSPKELQSGQFNRFIRGNLIRTQPGFRGFFRGTGIGNVMQANVEPQFDVFPNYVSYVTHLSSSRWPVLNYALESYLQDMSPSNRSMFMRFFLGLTSEEKTNLLLKDHSLSGLLGDPSLEPDTLNDILRVKGKALLALLEAKLGDGGGVEFRKKVAEFLVSHRFRTISESEWIAFIAALGDIDLPGIINSWYNGTQIPGYLLENLESYQVIDGERTRTQVKFRVTNSTAVEGLLRVSFRYRRRGRMFGGGGGGQDEEDYSRALLVPGKTSKDVAILIDQPPASMAIDTYVSQNIPSVITRSFRNLKVKKDAQPLEQEVSNPYQESKAGVTGEYVVDNEDKGFEIPGGEKENWLRRTLRGLLGSREDDAVYSGMNLFSPAAVWTATTYQEFYGHFIRSAVYKKAGNGESKVAWNVELGEPGDYDIYFYHEGEMAMMRFMRRGRGRQGGQQRKSGKKYFLILHEDGIEDVQVDLKGLEAGWNHLGTYRLVAGTNRVEMTDKNENGYVTADAVKWVKHSN